MADQAQTDAINKNWVQFWSKTDNPPWQLEKPNQGLVDHFDLLLKNAKTITVFVPLCGKSLDILWLYQGGHTVIGVEISEEAVEGFFTLTSMPFEKTTVGENIVLYKSKDERIQLFASDYFGFNRELLAGRKIDAVWDRGSFIAMTPPQRPRYIETLCSLIDRGSLCLFERIDHPDDGHELPYQFTLEELQTLCGSAFDMREISERTDEKNKQFHMKYSLWTKK